MQNRFEIGEPFETTVVAVTDSTIFIDLSAKSEGVVDRAEFADENGEVSIKEGDKIKVFFTGEVHGEMRFTSKISAGKADKELIENAYKNQIPVEGHVESEIKGGFEVKIGTTRAFCPYSQMGYKNKEEPAAYIGKNLTFLITEYKNEGRNVLVSNRKIGENEYNAQMAKIASEIKEGSIVEATVDSIQNFGAFVNIQGLRALLPISEVSFERVSDLNGVLEPGQEIKVKVIKADWQNEKVSVSLKALLADPWDSVEKDYPVGTKIDGKISRIADFGLFVNIGKGIDGLVHISDLEDVSSNTNLKKVYKPGQTISVVVKEVNAAKKRIALQTASSAEQDQTAAKYMSSQDDDDGETYNPFAALLKK